MTNKYFGGTVTNKGVAETEEDKAVDADLKAITEDTPKRVEAKMDELRVQMRSQRFSYSSNAATNISTRQCVGTCKRRG